ncbi:MAG TPA: homocysteine S-methyltransferase family protein [Candidatus Sulfotelmatobacter sp.]|nr:homocysteine S-methyltransferase family protein [Candidatus Sulfotelmatobacter sp.]
MFHSSWYIAPGIRLKIMIQDLLKRGPVLTDGAWGTELQKLGLAPGEIADYWNLSHPEKVGLVARSYVEAGSEIILTNTFRANRVALHGRQGADEVRDLNRRGVEISRSAAGAHARVFASIGPSGKLLLAEEVTEQELYEAFAEQANALADAAPDAIVIETMSDLSEATIALDAAKATGLPTIVCMVFDSGRGQDRTLTGVTPERAARELTARGADVIGANCGKGIDGFIGICQRLHASTDRPIWIKSNAGLPHTSGDSIVYDMTAEIFAGYVPQLVKAGASFIGGCCGTDPGFIRAISGQLHKLSLAS